MSVLQQNYAEVCRRIAEAPSKRRAGQAGEVGLIAVSKPSLQTTSARYMPQGSVISVKTIFGSGTRKRKHLRICPTLFWHVIGDVQSNKTKFVAERAHWVYAL